MEEPLQEERLEDEVMQDTMIEVRDVEIQTEDTLTEEKSCEITQSVVTEMRDERVQTEETLKVEKGVQTNPEPKIPAPAPHVKQKLDEDEFFAVNVIATVMKKLSATQKAKAKMEMLDILYKIEQED